MSVGGEKMEGAAADAAERLRKMEAELEAANAAVMAERRRRYVRPPVRFSAPVLKTKEPYVSKGFLRELAPAKFLSLRRAVQADDVAAFHALDVGFGSKLAWVDTPCSCVLHDRFSADRKFVYTFLDGVKEQRYEKHHPYLPSRHHEFTLLDACQAAGAAGLLSVWEQQQAEAADSWRTFELTKKQARVCAGCKQLVGDQEEHVFLSPPPDPAASANPEMTKSRYYHLPCCRCEDASCGIVLDSDNFFLVDIQWGRDPPGPTTLCRKHKLKQDVEKSKFERQLAAEQDEEMARQIKNEALRSKNPSEWVQVEADHDEGQLLAEGEDPPKYWLHKGTGYTQWETPQLVQAAIDQGALNGMHRTIYVQSAVPERERYLADMRQGVGGRKSVLLEIVPTATKDERQREEKERRFRDGFPEHVRFKAAQQVLLDLEEELARQATPAERQAGVGALTKERRRKIGRFFDCVAKQQEQVKSLKQQQDNTPDYLPTLAEAEHLKAEQKLCALVKQQAAAKAEERFATVLNLQPKIDALRKKESTLAPIVRRTRAKRANQRNFDLRSNPRDQFAGKVAQRLRSEAAGARQHGEP